MCIVYYNGRAHYLTYRATSSPHTTRVSLSQCAVCAAFVSRLLSKCVYWCVRHCLRNSQTDHSVDQPIYYITSVYYCRCALDFRSPLYGEHIRQLGAWKSARTSQSEISNRENFRLDQRLNSAEYFIARVHRIRLGFASTTDVGDSVTFKRKYKRNNPN